MSFSVFRARPHREAALYQRDNPRCSRHDPLGQRSGIDSVWGYRDALQDDRNHYRALRWRSRYVREGDCILIERTPEQQRAGTVLNDADTKTSSRGFPNDDYVDKPLPRFILYDFAAVALMPFEFGGRQPIALPHMKPKEQAP